MKSIGIFMAIAICISNEAIAGEETIVSPDDRGSLCRDRLEPSSAEDPMKEFGFPGPEEPSDTIFAFDEALAAQRSGNYNLAIELYNKHIQGGFYWGKNEAQNREMLSIAYGNRAAAHAEVGNFERALQDNRAARALLDNPEFHFSNEAEIFNTRALFALRDGLLEKSLQDFACATSLSPETAQLWANRCFVASLVRGSSEAREFCVKALDLDPENADAKFILNELPSD